MKTTISPMSLFEDITMLGKGEEGKQQALEITKQISDWSWTARNKFYCPMIGDHSRLGWCFYGLISSTDMNLKPIGFFYGEGQSYLPCVYLLQEEGKEGLIKIGSTRKFSDRIQPHTRKNKTLRILGILVGGRDLEKSLHKRFKHLLREGRKWFYPGKDLVECIENELDLYQIERKPLE